MSKRRRQFGQSMVEYTVVTSLGVLVLLGPGTDVIQYTLRSIQDNYGGYSYAMSLAQWPEFDIRAADTITPMVDTPAAGMADTGTRGGVLPPRGVPATTTFTDFDIGSYRTWLVSQGLSDDEATALAGADLSEVSARLDDFLEGGGDFLSFPDIPVDLPPSISDILEDVFDPSAFF